MTTTSDRIRATTAERETAPEPPQRVSRAQRRAAARAFRPSRTLPAVVAAGALAAASILTTAEVVAGLIHRRVHLLPVAWLTRFGHDTHWHDPAAIVTAAIACLFGVLLIALALVPGRPRIIALTPRDPHTVIGITRTGLRRHLAAAATEIDGITRARVHLGRRLVRVKAASPLRDARGLSQQVHQAVTGRLDELAPLRRLRVRVTVRRRKD
ncbi:MAG: hypothetical protein JWN52_915 [Actinomycetia bacterium]|nr:hypothetical protein [Actinomycetes bacterium]